MFDPKSKRQVMAALDYSPKITVAKTNFKFRFGRVSEETWDLMCKAREALVDVQRQAYIQQTVAKIKRKKEQKHLTLQRKQQKNDEPITAFEFDEKEVVDSLDKELFELKEPLVSGFVKAASKHSCPEYLIQQAYRMMLKDPDFDFTQAMKWLKEVSDCAKSRLFFVFLLSKKNNPWIFFGIL